MGMNIFFVAVAATQQFDFIQTLCLKFITGGVFTKDLGKAHRVSEALEAGSVWINTFNLVPSEVPFGGFKMSGIGRECGLAAIEHYTQTKTIYVEMNDVDCGQLYQE